MAVGVLGALAVAASAAGWWAPAGIVLAAVIAFLARPAADPDGTGPAAPELGGRRARLLGGLSAAVRLAAVVVAATTCAAYLAPGHRAAVAVVVVVVVALADIAGVRLDAYWRRWVGGLLTAAAIAFVALCLGIAPAVEHDPVAAPPVPGVLLAAAVFVPWFAGLSGRRLAAGAALALAVTGAALYQLGALRLGLSPTSLRDVFAAADARAVEPALGAVVVLATVPAALVAFSGARAGLASRARVARAVVPAVVAALLAAVLSPLGALLVAAALALGEIVAGVFVRGSRRPRDVATAVLAVALFGGLVTGL
ncbi:hypothetical protein ACFS2C_11980 [Prauserella oleivorans]|uniref:Uncharacterized protein n=1 Tax=Prauserella oleivorans TaxID=1478153 RepID=A0ABW5WCL3_9PSEU